MPKKKRWQRYRDLTIADMPAGFIDYMKDHDDDNLPDGAWGQVLKDAALMLYEANGRQDLLKVDSDGHEAWLIYVKETANQ